MDATKRVALNTGILYARMILTVGITLYTTRLVLNALGATDFGIYNVIASTVFILSFLNTAMATSTQRYLSFYEGSGDMVMQKKVLSSSLVLHLFLGLCIVVGLEVAGFFLFDGFLNIPEDRIEVAKTVYHLTSATVLFTIISVPFNASLIAHENMLWVAVVNIVESLLKLLIAIILFIYDGDKLLIYGILIAFISFFTFMLYAGYCYKFYEECKVRIRDLNWDKPLLKELSSNASWNLFGVLGGIGKNQGMAILLNVFFGARINSAFGIGNQVSGQLNFFSGTMLRAVNPQIMKSEGDNNRERMIRISLLACKYCFLLLAVIAIPCMFELPMILKLWLKNVPEHTVEICTYILIAFMVNQITMGLDSAAQATGRIKSFMIMVGSAKLLIVPVGYVLLKTGFGLFSAFLAYILLEAIGGIIRVYSLKKLVNLSPALFFRMVILPVLLPMILTFAANYLIVYSLSMSYRILITFGVSTIVFVLSVILFSMTKYEKDKFKSFLSKFIKKLAPVKN